MDKLREKMSALHKNVAINIPEISLPSFYGNSPDQLKIYAQSKLIGNAPLEIRKTGDLPGISSENSPLIILDGVVLNPDLKVSQEAIDQYKNLNPEDIQSIEVKNDTKLLEQYPHVRAKNGVIEILTKK